MRPRFFPFVVLLLVAIPAWMALVSVAGVVMPWFVFGFLMWGIFVVARGPRRGRLSRGRYYWEPLPPQAFRSRSAPPRPRPELRPAPPSRAVPKQAPHAELPIDVQVKVEQIRRKVEVLLGYASRFPPFSKDLYLVRQTAGDYLPRTIDAYFKLSPEALERPIPGTGRPPLQELKEQLQLLDSKLDDIAEDLQRQDLDRLLANRVFLEQRFGPIPIEQPAQSRVQ
ncbi:MAG: hypothetical protein KGJ86_05135 [Chloroflexota bacterium]|nr:hypothetical protein [Chloroflexota bacterium]